MIEPVTIGPCQLYLGDCREVLAQLPSGSVDSVITDPPYNVGINYGEGTDDNRPADEFREWVREWFTECRRVSQTVMVTGQARLPDYAQIEPWKWLIAWWKPAAMGRSPVGFCNWEPVALWGKGGTDGVDFIRAPIVPDPSVGWHPCPKPLRWATELMRLVPWAETFCDPFCGSGTTAVASVRMGKQFIGIEKEPAFFDRLCQRVESEVNADRESLFPINEERSRLPLEVA